MQTFFGVTPTQSADSRFSQFSAGSGFKDVGAGINANYRFDEHWFIGANADVKELTGDAAKSPISYSNTEGTFMTMVGYHF
jgi:outer membrane scaffolding protein for murein synthesis (MipA/OmpV family)